MYYFIKSEIILLFVIIIVLLLFLYKRWQDKIQENDDISYKNIQKYLLQKDDDLGLLGNKKPILWIHIPHEYNSRNWLSFGSRSSFDLNQPYLYLCVKSIIKHCNKSFHICLIDDHSFEKLIPNWDFNIDMISSPIRQNIRTYALSQLLYIYGGMLVPISFACMKDLIGIYNSGVSSKKIFVCENVNKNVSSSDNLFYSDMTFMGAERDNQVIIDFIEYIKTTIQNDFTAESHFTGKLNNWLQQRAGSGQIHLISGKKIGVKDMDDQPVSLDALMGQSEVHLALDTYGLLIPCETILSRTKYQWFARLSAKQVLDADTFASKYILLCNAPTECFQGDKKDEVSNKWIGFWRTPLVDTWGLKPNFLGDNLVKEEQPNY